MRFTYAATALVMGAMVFAQNPLDALKLTATSANVAGSPDAIRIEIVRWSSDEEQVRMVTAWNQKPAATTVGAGAGKGAAKAGKGAPKGPGSGEVVSPEVSLSRALQANPTVGYLWSSETAGYALRYAGKFVNADGSQRIVLHTQRRLGAVNQQWKPSGTPNAYDFSVIELRLNAKGEGEGKISLIGKIAPDSSIKIVTLENYAGLPVMLSDVRVRADHR